MKRLPLPGFLLLASCAGASPPGDRTAEQWWKAAEQKLTQAATAQWDVEIEVEADGNRLYRPSYPERQTWHFKVKGADRASWRQDEGHEFRYASPTLAVLAEGKVETMNFGESEGLCILQSLLKGGTIGWQLVHSSLGFEYSRVHGVARDSVDGRPAVVLEQEFKLDTPGSTDPEFKGIRLWLDAETGLPLCRTFSLLSTHGAAAKPFRATETYSHWKLDEPLDDALFKPQE